MTDRLEISISGDLPDARKFAILASAEESAKEFAAALTAKHPGIDLKVSVKAVRPGKKTGDAASTETNAADPNTPTAPSTTSGEARPAGTHRPARHVTE